MPDTRKDRHKNPAVTTRPPADVTAWVDRYAQSRGLTRTEVVTRALLALQAREGRAA